LAGLVVVEMAVEIMAELQQLQQELPIPAAAVAGVDMYLAEPQPAEKADPE
jgi:hypothetical protein